MTRKSNRRPAVNPPTIARVDSVVDKCAGQSLRQVGQRAEILVVAVALSGEECMQRVMEILVPLRIESVAAGLAGYDDPRLVEVTLGDQNQMAAERSCEDLDFGGELLEKMDRAGVEERVHGVDAQTVEMVVPQPH